MTPASLNPTAPDGNLLADLPGELSEERFQTILSQGVVRMERIVSRGHTSPADGWWDQSQQEWILVLQGGGTLLFADGREITLNPGDHLFIPAHDQHKVIWTDPDKETIWLAVFWEDSRTGNVPEHDEW